MKSNVVVPQDKMHFLVASDGIDISLTLDKVLDETLSLKKVLKESLSGAACIECLKIQIIVAQDIHVDVIDDLLDFDINVSKLEFVLNAGSTVNYELKMLQAHKIDQANDGAVPTFSEQDSIEKELNFKFIGELSRAKVQCSCKGEHERLFRFKTIQDHQAANTKSDLVIKGVFSQKSKLICDSLIRVNKEAHKVDATQLSKNLLLGEDSRAVCLPKLEVRADDVKCKHGAAVSKLDEDLLFYMQSRGMDYCQAKNLLVDAFLN